MLLPSIRALSTCSRVLDGLYTVCECRDREQMRTSGQSRLRLLHVIACACNSRCASRGPPLPLVPQLPQIDLMCLPPATLKSTPSPPSRSAFHLRHFSSDATLHFRSQPCRCGNSSRLPDIIASPYRHHGPAAGAAASILTRPGEPRITIGAST